MPRSSLWNRLLRALHLREPTLPELLVSLRQVYEEAQSPHPLWEHPEFQRGVRLIAAELAAGKPMESFSSQQGPIVSLMSVEAAMLLQDRAQGLGCLIAALSDSWPWTRHRALSLIQTRAAEPVLVRILTSMQPLDDEPLRYALPALKSLAASRRDAEHDERLGDRLAELPAPRREFVEHVVEALAAEFPPGIVEEVRSARRRRVPIEQLRSIGRVWEALPDEADDLEAIHADHSEPTLQDLQARLTGEPARPVLLVGEGGTGKSALIRQVARRLQRAGWVIFEASAADLIAGQTYIGQIEGRVRTLLEALSGRNVLWVIPSFHELAYAGATIQDPAAVLDQVLSWLDRGPLRMIGETRPQPFERLLLRSPRLRTAVTLARVESLDAAGTLALAERWCECAARRGLPTCDAATCREAAELAVQYLSDLAQPGALLKLLRVTAERLVAPGQPATPFGLDDVYETLARLTGLPIALLDDRRQLALDGLRAHFEKRVLGQPEAVDRLVERVAMIKAGVADPRRPLGVFLFVGPTGTGKTEIARTLTEYLFGGVERMIRLDMSEFQLPESIDGILGDRDPFAGAQALVHRIRRQPFSVLLLDEFEKAHPRVWDLFLQVFDDGRLTDRRGDVADFRHAIIILTSNLGAAIPAGTRLGFQNGSSEYAPGSVMRAIETTFRREFINRLDHIVVFRPLARSTMREVVRKELAEVFARRGLRNRAWAVEWDDSAIDFLLEKGFTADLGARPLRRAIEQHLLAPLATTIVRHEVPAGDQFLFVRAEANAIQVRFVDPDAPEDEPTAGDYEPATAPVAPDDLDLRDIVLEPRGTPAELAFLRARLESIEALVAGESWQSLATQTYAAMQADGFWRAGGRFEVLGRAENLDRVRTALGTARSLSGRLAGSPARGRMPADVVRALAQQLYLLEAATDALLTAEPWEAFISVRPLAGQEADATDAFAARLVAMYTKWAQLRRMRLEVLEPGGPGRRWVAAVSGFAAWRMLRPEHGLHVHESESVGSRAERLRAEVRVAPQPPEPAGTATGLLEQALAALGEAPGDAAAIVRRYRDLPTPLVRDGVRGFRTGRLDRVLGGQFDLLR